MLKKELEQKIVEVMRDCKDLARENAKKLAEIKELKDKIKLLSEDIVIEFEEEEVDVIGQIELVSAFKIKLKETIKKFHNTTVKEATPRQKELIRNGMRDKVGMELNTEQIAFINNLNVNQASNVIRDLSAISWFNQRKALSEVLVRFEDREDYATILKRVKKDIWKAEYFNANKNLINAISEMESPTDAQVRRIANLAIYPETTYTLERDFNIVVDEYEIMTDKGYYTFNWAKLKNDIASRMTKSDCYNFIQTYDYITNYYSSNELDNAELKELKSNYIRLGEIECTRLTYLKTIQKKDFNRIVSEQESRIRANQIANNLDKDVLRELFKFNDVDKNLGYLNAKEQNIQLTEEEKNIKDLVNFTFSIYSCIGQEVPEEMAGILPYFVDKDKCASVSPNHIKEFRNLVFTQREVIKEVDPKFNWAYFICSQSNEVLKVLGLDALL